MSDRNLRQVLVPKGAVLPKLSIASVLVAVFVCVVSITFLASSVKLDIDGLASANSDTTQWSLAQTEVDLLALRLAASDAIADEASDLSTLRRRFDIFYSRVNILDDSQQFAGLRAIPEAAGQIARMTGFLDTWTPLFDGEDAALRAALPDLPPTLDTLRADVRAFSSRGVRWFAADSDRRREQIAALLTTIGFLTFALVLTLSLVVVALLWMIRRSARAERAADETGNRLQNVISTSIDAILAVDRDGRVLDFNGAAEAMFGYSRDEAMGQDMADLIIPDHLRNAHNTGMQRFRETGERRVVGKGLLRLDARRRDGSVFPVELTISTVEERGKQIFVSYLRDVSKQVAAERELVEARDRAVAGEKAKAELLAVMSHEMRTPLNGLLGMLQLLEDTRLGASQRKYLSAMETSAKLLLHHVNDVLTISRAEAGQLHLVPTEVAPAELLAELVESQRRAIELNGNRITLSVDPEPARIWADRVRVNQIFLNFVGNANKFTRGGEINVEFEGLPDGRTVELRVIDNGIGIDEADQERIFEDFRTLDASYGRTAEGTGLGLAISKRLVTTMGGEIGVESEPGEGSLFWVRLPIGQPAETSGRPGTRSTTRKRAARTVGPTKSVLLVEDNQINRMVAREMLERGGHTVTEAHDGREGLHFASRVAYDVILMDISMPEVDGVTATQEIRAGDGPNRQTPIVALTAHALPEDLARFEAAGVNRTLVKPLTWEALQQVLEDPSPSEADTAPETSSVIADLADQLGPAKAAELLGTFLGETDALADRLREPAADPAAQQALAAEVHKSAGSAAVFRCGDLVERLRALETAMKTGDAAARASAASAFRDSWSGCRERLAACRASLAVED